MKNLIKILLLLLLIIQPISAIPSTVTIKPKIYTKDGLLRGLHDVRVKMYDQDRNVIFEELVPNVMFDPRGWGSIELGKGVPYPPKEALNAESISMGFILPKYSNEEEEIIGMVSIGFALMAKEAGSIEFKGIKNFPKLAKIEGKIDPNKQIEDNSIDPKKLKNIPASKIVGHLNISRDVTDRIDDGEVALTVTNETGNTESGSAVKVISNRGRNSGVFTAVKNERGESLVRIGSFTETPLELMYAYETVVRLDNELITATNPIIAPYFQGDGSRLTNLPFNAYESLNSAGYFGGDSDTDLLNKAETIALIASTQSTHSSTTDRATTADSINWNLEQSLTQSSVLFSGDQGLSLISFKLKNKSINNKTGAQFTAISDDIDGRFGAKRSELGQKQVFIGSFTDANLLFFRDQVEKVSIEANKVVFANPIQADGSLITSLDVSNADRGTLSTERYSAYDDLNSEGRFGNNSPDDLLKKSEIQALISSETDSLSVGFATSAGSATTASSANNINFSSPLVLNSNTPTFRTNFATGISSFVFENQAANTNAGSEIKVKADNGDVEAVLKSHKDDSGKKIVTLGAESDAEVQIIRNDGAVITITNTNFTSTHHIIAPSFSGNGALITHINANNISSGTVPNARLDPQLQDLADGSLSGSLVGSGINAGNISSGTVPYARTNTYGDLGNEGRLNNNHNDDLMTKKQINDLVINSEHSTSTTYTPLPKNQSGGTVAIQEFYTKATGLNLDGTHTHTINLGINSSVYDVISVEITIFSNGNSGFPVNFIRDFGTNTEDLHSQTGGDGFQYLYRETLDSDGDTDYHWMRRDIAFQSQLNARYYVYPSGSSTYVKLYIRSGGYFDSSSFNSAKIGIVSNTIKK